MRALLVVALAACTSTPPSESKTCGAGTTLDGQECVAPPTGCGAGTSESSGMCLVTPTPDVVVRAPARIAADPNRIVDIYVAGDAVASARVTPPTAGTLGAPANGTMRFTPCDPEASGCVGPATIEVLSTTGAIVGTANVELTTAPVFATGELCRGMQIADHTGFVVWGRGTLAPDDMTLREAAITATGANRHLEIEIADASTAPWSIVIDTVQAQRDLTPGVFIVEPQEDAPWFSVRTQGPYAGCDWFGPSAFEIIDYDPTPPARVTLAFQLVCSYQGFTEAHGCVHIE